MRVRVVIDPPATQLFPSDQPFPADLDPPDLPGFSKSFFTGCGCHCRPGFVTHYKLDNDGRVVWRGDFGNATIDIAEDSDGNVYVLGTDDVNSYTTTWGHDTELSCLQASRMFIRVNGVDRAYLVGKYVLNNFPTDGVVRLIIGPTLNGLASPHSWFDLISRCVRSLPVAYDADAETVQAAIRSGANYSTIFQAGYGVLCFGRSLHRGVWICVPCWMSGFGYRLSVAGDWAGWPDSAKRPDSRTHTVERAQLRKYDSDGELLWSKLVDQRYDFRGLAITPDDDVYVCGRLLNPPAVQRFPDIIQPPGKLCKIDTDGNTVWEQTCGVYLEAVDCDADRVVAGGWPCIAAIPYGDGFLTSLTPNIEMVTSIYDVPMICKLHGGKNLYDTDNHRLGLHGGWFQLVMTAPGSINYQQTVTVREDSTGTIYTDLLMEGPGHGAPMLPPELSECLRVYIRAGGDDRPNILLPGDNRNCTILEYGYTIFSEILPQQTTVDVPWNCTAAQLQELIRANAPSTAPVICTEGPLHIAPIRINIVGSNIAGGQLRCSNEGKLEYGPSIRYPNTRYVLTTAPGSGYKNPGDLTHHPLQAQTIQAWNHTGDVLWRNGIAPITKVKCDGATIQINTHMPATAMPISNRHCWSLAVLNSTTGAVQTGFMSRGELYRAVVRSGPRVYSGGGNAHRTPRVGPGAPHRIVYGTGNPQFPQMYCGDRNTTRPPTPREPRRSYQIRLLANLTGGTYDFQIVDFNPGVDACRSVGVIRPDPELTATLRVRTIPGVSYDTTLSQLRQMVAAAGMATAADMMPTSSQPLFRETAAWPIAYRTLFTGVVPGTYTDSTLAWNIILRPGATTTLGVVCQQFDGGDIIWTSPVDVFRWQSLYVPGTAGTGYNAAYTNRCEVKTDRVLVLVGANTAHYLTAFPQQLIYADDFTLPNTMPDVNARDTMIMFDTDGQRLWSKRFGHDITEPPELRIANGRDGIYATRMNNIRFGQEHVYVCGMRHEVAPEDPKRAVPGSRYFWEPPPG